MIYQSCQNKNVDIPAFVGYNEIKGGVLMIYSNDDPMAILAMEIARTDNYGEYDSYDGGTVCPVCGAFEPEHYYINDDEECIGCSECVRKSDVMY